MKLTVTQLMIATILFGGTHAFAADPAKPDPAAQAQKQALKKCMAKQKEENTGASRGDLEKACRAAVKERRTGRMDTTVPE